MTRPRVSVPRSYVAASLATLALAVVATGTGLFVEGFYRDAPVLVPQVLGQDLLTLVVALPALAVGLYAAVRGSLRGYVVWLGVTGYLLYTYASYAFMTAFNPLYLVYVALFGLTLFTFVGAVARVDPRTLQRAVDLGSVRPYVGYQVLVAVLVGFAWLSELVPASLAGTVPPSIAATGLPVNVIYSLDLAVVLPAFVVSAVLLRRRRPWGYVFTGVLLVKGTTLGLAVLSMVVFMLRDGQPVPPSQVVIFSVLSLAGLVLTVRFVRSIRPVGRRKSGGRTAGLLSGVR
ncbi:hypothetical protein ACFQH6_14780 [Halobacteriaceae archaeon GCM10025711]